jgi:hypothetical protein
MGYWRARRRWPARVLGMTAAGLAIFAGGTAAHAEPPEGRAIAASAIVCDTVDQLRAIVTAGRTDLQSGALAEFSALSKQLDASREPSCTIIGVNSASSEVIKLGGFSFLASRRNGWAVHIHRGAAAGWMLYSEAVASGGHAFADARRATQ